MKKRIFCLLCMICLVDMAWCNLPWTGNKTLSGWDWNNRLNIPAGDFIGCQVGDMIGVNVSWIPANDAWIDVNGLTMSVSSTGTIGILVDEKIANELDYQWGGLNIRGNVTVTRVGYYKVNKSRIICAGSGISNATDDRQLGGTPASDPDGGEPKTDLSDLQVGDRIVAFYDNVNDNSRQSIKYAPNGSSINTEIEKYQYDNARFTRLLINVNNGNISQLKSKGLEYYGSRCQLLNAFVIGNSYNEHFGGGQADARYEGTGNPNIFNNYQLGNNNVNILFTGPKKMNSGSYLSAEDKVSFEASRFGNYNIGDTLYVYTSNEKSFAEGFIRYQNQAANNFGEQNDGIVSKMGKYLVKGSYFQVIDAKMLEIIKSKGLDVGGKGHNIEYIVIRKGREGINTANDDHTGNRFTWNPTKIAENVNSSSVSIPYNKLYNNGTYHAYWGDVIYVETDGTKDNTCSISINGQNLTTPLKCNDDFVMYLKFDDKNTLINRDNANKNITVSLSEGKIKNVYLVKETRKRNIGDVTANGEVDWGREQRVSVDDIGNLEVGDKITIYGHTVNTRRNSQYSLQILHYGEIDSKGLSYVVNHGYHDIYDRLTYSDIGGAPREWKEFNSSNYVDEYTVPTASMADAIRKNTFSVTGSNFFVDRINVNSKTFVYPQKVGSLQYATMCAPYNIEMPYSDDLRAYAITGIDGRNLILTQVQRIPMGAAVVLFKKNNVTEEDFNLSCFDNISLTEEEKAAFGNNLLIGDIVNKQVTNNDDYTYYMLAYNKPFDKPEKEVAFFRVEGTVTAGAYKSYLRLPNNQVPAGAKSFGFVFADDVDSTDDAIQTTGIQHAETGTRDAYYNIWGQKTLHPTKGLYIRNNKKIIIK